MTKDIIAATLGFLTIPMAVGVITGAVFGGKLIGSFGLSSNHYWVGFWSLLGIAVVVGICIALYFAVTEFRNL